MQFLKIMILKLSKWKINFNLLGNPVQIKKNYRSTWYYLLTLSTACCISLSLRHWLPNRCTISPTSSSVTPGVDFSTNSNAFWSSSIASLFCGPWLFECFDRSCNYKIKLPFPFYMHIIIIQYISHKLKKNPHEKVNNNTIKVDQHSLCYMYR